MGEDAELANRRAFNSEGLARLATILREHGFDPAPVASATSCSPRPAATRPRSTTVCSAKA